MFLVLFLDVFLVIFALNLGLAILKDNCIIQNNFAVHIMVYQLEVLICVGLCCYLGLRKTRNL
jgi:hypothetical protein